MTATFADTNILVYAATPLTAPSRAKSEIARAVLAENEIVISTQVLQEFYWAATRPHKLNLTHTDAVGWLDIFKRFPVQPITLSVVEDALFLCASYQLSYWDAAIIAAARHLDCHTLLSEDLNHGQLYGGVLVQNPFAKLEHKE